MTYRVLSEYENYVPNLSTPSLHLLRCIFQKKPGTLTIPEPPSVGKGNKRKRIWDQKNSKADTGLVIMTVSSPDYFYSSASSQHQKLRASPLLLHIPDYTSLLRKQRQH